VAKTQLSVDEIANWLIEILEEEHECVWSRQHPMDDIDWVRRRAMVEECRRTGDTIRLRWLAAEYAERAGYRREWAF
jgi:hypothetical protein